MTTRKRLTTSERALPYADFYDRPSAMVPPAVLHDIQQKTHRPKDALAIENINDLLIPGYLPIETGHCRMPNGSFFVAVRTEFRGVSAEMIEWWFDWHPKDSMRYRIWYPECHYEISMKDLGARSAGDPPHWNTVHYPIEDIGLGKETLAIHFLPPAEFGFDTARFEEANIATVICANVGSVSKNIKQQAQMCHLLRKIDGGLEMRSRFWLGDKVAMSGFRGSEVVQTLANKKTVRQLIMPSKTGLVMAMHCAQEYNNLAQILPDLYHTFGSSKGQRKEPLPRKKHMKDIDQLISEMTLEEKASLCSGKNFWHMQGIDRLGIPSIMVTDGPHGLRKQMGDSDHVGLSDSVPATCFPTASALAATWNRELIREVGEALGDECRAEKVAVLLGPGINIKRSPLCGRNFEYFSEDPYLSGEMAKSHINGVQSKGVGTSLKHYSVNNQEFRRMTLDAVVDERALHEIYLPGYEIAIKEAQPWTVMCAYNRVNGTYAAEHPELMTTILKEAWGHEGLVVTDWGAMNDRVAGLEAGVELEMPGTKNGNDEKIVAAVRSGQLSEAVLDGAVRRLLQLIAKAEPMLAENSTYDVDAHHALARKAAGESIVLLKNEGGALPLVQGGKVALIGRFAKHPRFQGAGSSLVNPTKVDNLYDELVALVGTEHVSYAEGYGENGKLISQRLIKDAVAVAQSAETVVVCVGLPDSFEVEGLDREHIDLPPAHDALVSALASAHQNIVVVLSNGSPVAMPWIDNVAAIVEGYLGGQAGAGGVADVLTGAINPSGKLAETFPIRLADNPSYRNFPGGPNTVEYRESLYVGYRFYDAVEQAVLFPFGHGLSYTQFEYGDLEVSASEIVESDVLRVSCSVKNVGDVAGQEVVQVYVRDVEAGVFRPKKELKAFTKVALEPNEQTTVTFELNRRAFAYYSPAGKDWVVESGQFEIIVGASAQDIRLQTMVQVNAERAVPSERAVPAAYFNFPKNGNISQHDFEALLGRAVPANESDTKGSYTLNTPISDMQDTLIGRQLFKFMNNQASKMVVGDEDSPNGQLIQAVLKDAPLRMLLMLGDGAISAEMLEGLVRVLNGSYVSGVRDIVKAVRGK